jgi:hypothetical protein
MLFLLGLSLLGGGYYWYSQQQEVQERLRQTQERFKTPPYFVNRGATISRSCGRCLDLGKLKPQPEWKVGPASEIPNNEQRWFLAVEEPPLPVTVSGVLMLPVHPAFQENPSFGFDQNRVELVPYQNLQRMAGIEQFPPPTPAVSQVLPSESSSSDPSAQSGGPTEAASSDNTTPSATSTAWQSAYIGDWKNVYSDTVSLTRLLITSEEGKLQVHAWHSCYPEVCDWGTVTVDSPPASKHLAVVWNQSDAIRQLELSLEVEGLLKSTLKSHFFVQAAHVDSNIVLYFTRSAAP